VERQDSGITMLSLLFFERPPIDAEDYGAQSIYLSGVMQGAAKRMMSRRRFAGLMASHLAAFDVFWPNGTTAPTLELCADYVTSFSRLVASDALSEGELYADMGTSISVLVAADLGVVN